MEGSTAWGHRRLKLRNIWTGSVVPILRSVPNSPTPILCHSPLRNRWLAMRADTHRLLWPTLKSVSTPLVLEFVYPHRNKKPSDCGYQEQAKNHHPLKRAGFDFLRSLPGKLQIQTIKHNTN